MDAQVQQNGEEYHQLGVRSWIVRFSPLIRSLSFVLSSLPSLIRIFGPPIDKISWKELEKELEWTDGPFDA